MTTLHLVRYAYTPDQTLGVLKFPIPSADPGESVPNQYALWTVECPWQNNLPFFSCIADGTYRLSAHDSATHPGCWIVSPVAGRTGILIHAGNKVEDVTGCIAVGMTRLDLSVYESADAMKLLNYVLPRGEQHHLVIGPGLGAVMPGPGGTMPSNEPGNAENSD